MKKLTVFTFLVAFVFCASVGLAAGMKWFVIKDVNGVCKVIQAKAETPKTVGGPFSSKAAAMAGKAKACKKSVKAKKAPKPKVKKKPAKATKAKKAVTKPTKAKKAKKADKNPAKDKKKAKPAAKDKKKGTKDKKK